MAVQIPRFLQTKQYSAKDVRAMLLDLPIQTGAVGATDFDVAQRAAGANMSVDVAAGAAWLKGTTSARQGIYNFYNDGVVNVTINAAHATLPRIDQIIVRAYDSVDGGAGQDIGAIEYLAGTATSGATLDNRTGAAALPANSFRVADVLVGAAVTSITNANIRDRRPWAHGAYHLIERTAGDYTSSSGSFAAIDSVNLAPRIECSGAPLEIELFTAIRSSAGGVAEFGTFGLLEDATARNSFNVSAPQTAAGLETAFLLKWAYAPAPGSHVFTPRFATDGTGSITITANASQPLRFIVRELVTQNASNS